MLKTRHIIIFSVIGIIGLAGVLVYQASRAATPYASLEVEAGTVKSTATVITDSTAAGQKAVVFAAPTSTAHDYLENFDTNLAAWPANGSAAAGYGPKGLNKYGFCAYADGSNGTNNVPSVYWPSKVVSIHDGYLDMYNHAAMASAILPFCYNGFTYGTWSVTMRVTASGGDSGGTYNGYHNAFLLWPDDGSGKTWPAAGEFDYPESDTSQTNPYMAIVQPAGGFLPATTSRTAKPWSDGAWRKYTTQWGPGFVRTYQDGVLVNTVTTGIPTWPMHPVLQNEFYSAPSTSITGHTQVTQLTYDKSYTIQPSQF